MTKYRAKSREIVEIELAEMIKAGNSNQKQIDLLVKMYATTVSENDFTIDSEGTLKVTENCYLKYVDQTKMSKEQESTCEQIHKKVFETFDNSVKVNARRLSLSLKRKPINDDQEKENNKPKHQKRVKSSPKNNKK